jgi:hypothetical protein
MLLNSPRCLSILLLQTTKTMHQTLTQPPIMPKQRECILKHTFLDKTQNHNTRRVVLRMNTGWIFMAQTEFSPKYVHWVFIPLWPFEV